MRDSLVIGSGLSVLVVSLVFPLMNDSTQKSNLMPPSIYSEETRTNIELKIPPRVGGGGCREGMIFWKKASIKPKVVFPKSVGDSGSFLVGINIDVESMSGVLTTSCSGDFEGTYEELYLSQLPEDERKKQISKITFPVELSLAGVEVSPENEGRVSVSRGFWWSVAPTRSGKLNGRVLIGYEAYDVSNKESQALSIDINQKSNQSIGINVSSGNSDIKYVLSLVGAVLGSLLASLPAWLAWLEKRRPNKALQRTSR